MVTVYNWCHGSPQKNEEYLEQLRVCELLKHKFVKLHFFGNNLSCKVSEKAIFK